MRNIIDQIVYSSIVLKCNDIKPSYFVVRVHFPSQFRFLLL